MKTVGVVLSFICVASLLVRGQEVVDPEAGPKIIALENAWNRAAEVKDLKSLDALLDPAFVFVNLDGRLLRKGEVLADVKASPVQQVVAEGMTVQAHGNTAMVTGIFRMKGIEVGKPFVRRGRFIDTWVRKEGKWVCIASQLTPTLH